MARSFIQPSRAIIVIPSDTINIPNPAAMSHSSTNSAATINELEDSSARFATGQAVHIGDIVYNDTTLGIATVVSIDSDTVLTLSANIFPPPTVGEAYRIFRKDQNLGCLLYVGRAGHAILTTAGGDTVPLQSLPAGFNDSLQVVRADATVGAGAADDLVAIFN